MTRSATKGLVLVMVMTMATIMFQPSDAASITRTSRETSYPPEIENITHDPWNPSFGDDIRVLATLNESAAVPDGVSLLFCRVEPEYTCALPVIMQPDDSGRSWRGTIEWDPKFMKPETVHVGYNVTLRYPGHDDEGVERIYAPTGNYWIPDTFPEDSDGFYFFVGYGGAPLAPESPGPSVFVLVALTLAVGLVSRWRR